jgi:hypothetical protein
MPKALVPAQRVGAEEEMAGTILYLASKAGGYCNGSVVLVDGGVLSIHPSTYGRLQISITIENQSFNKKK